MTKHRVVMMLGMMSFLQACQFFQGTPVVLKPSGVVSLQEKPKGAGKSTGAVRLFELSYKKAEDEQRAISGGGPGPTKADDPVSIHARQMALDGVNLVNVYCNDFFRTRGDSQTVLNVSRDVTAASGSLASSVLAFASPANAVASGILSLVTSTASSSLDVYTRNFLFGSDNIETVRTMTLTALAAHRTAAFPANDRSVWDFGGATTVIMDHQDLCTPASIRSLVLASISKSKFEVKTPATKPDLVGAAQKAAAEAAPGVTGLATAATNAVALAAPAAQLAADQARAAGDAPAEIARKAVAAAQPQVKAVMDQLPATLDQQEKVTATVSDLIGASAAAATQLTVDRHIPIQVAN